MQLSINRQSALFKVARSGGLRDSDQTDLCSVARAFLWGALRVPFWMAIISVLGAAAVFVFVVYPTIILMVWLQYGILYGLDTLVIVGIAWTAITFFAYSYWADTHDRRNVVAAATMKAATSTAGLVAAGYRGWKDKTCVMVTVK